MAEMLMFPLTPPMSLCIRVSGFFIAWLFSESSRQLIPRRKWHLDIRHCMGLE